MSGREKKKKKFLIISQEKIKNLFFFFFFAAIYEKKDQFCLITEKASENINEIHHRQPVILNSFTDVNRYLSIELSGSDFLNKCIKPKLTFYEISKDVNKPINNTPSLIQPKNN